MPNVNNDARTTSDWETYIGEQCRSTRIRANLEQEEVATLANVSTGAVKNLEGGKGSSLKTLIKVFSQPHADAEVAQEDDYPHEGLSPTQSWPHTGVSHVPSC